MSIFDDALLEMEHNRNNRHNCIPYDKKLPRFSEYLPGIEKSNYYLITGSSGAGKSQLTDDFFIFSPHDFCLEEDTDIEVSFDYYSLELDKRRKMHHWISRRLYTHYGIRTGIKILESVGKNRLSDNVWMAVKETRKYFEKLESHITLYDGIITPLTVAKNTERFARDNGKIIKKQSIDDSGKVSEVFDKYIPNNPKLYKIIVLDHYSLLTCSGGKNIKQTIEDLSKYFVMARNRYGFIPVPIQQMNGESENLDHFKNSKLLPSKEGLAESKLTYNDCDTAIGIFSPWRHEIKTFRAYNIMEMRDCFRYLNIFKGRWGSDSVGVGLYFDGAVNYFKEMPKAEQTSFSHYEMIKQRKPNW